MPSKGRDWLRTFVLKTNRIWPMGQCNRLPYTAALRLFVGIFRRRPEIASIYVSHGFAGDHWIPGLSDIDLTVILENGLSDEEEYSFLVRFWRAYHRLRHYFPMLGEVIILVECEFGLWQTYSSTTTHGRRWVLLHGRETARSIHIDEAVCKKRALNAALWMYLESLPPCLSRRDSYLRQQDVARRARKIFRYVGAAEPMERPRDSPQTAAAILKALEAAAIDLSGVTSPVRLGDDVRGVISTHSGRVLVVLEDGLDKSALSRLIRVHLPSAPRESAPALLPHSLFEYMITRYNPYSYGRLQSRGTVQSGEVPLAGIRPPGLSEFTAVTLDRLAYLLPLTRSEVLLSAREPFPRAVVERAVTDALAVQLLLRDDWVGAEWQSVEAACRAAFPECYRELDLVREFLAAGNDGAARRTAFAMLRPIAAGILELAGGSAKLLER